MSRMPHIIGTDSNGGPVGHKLQYNDCEILLTCCDGNTRKYNPGQRNVQDSFPDQTWVKGVYNNKSGHTMGVLTTAFGLVLEDHEICVPYDVHITHFPQRPEIAERFRSSISNAVRELGSKVILIHSGWCPLSAYASKAAEAANTSGADVLGFGKRNIDLSRIPWVLERLHEGVTLQELRQGLKEDLLYFPAACPSHCENQPQ